MDYELLEKLGEGGMAKVFRAAHRRRDAHVAVKVLAKSSRREDLEGEVRAVARMSHPNIVNVLDVGVIPHNLVVGEDTVLAGQNFFVMDLVEGGSLEKHGPLRWLALKELLLNVLAGLAHAHARGVVHRDLKPSNILIENTRHGLLPKVSDFGIAQIDVGWITTENGSFSGTPAYMAPEQIRGLDRDLGPWTDLYAVGCMAYELVAGRPPFDAPHPLDILQKHLKVAPPRLQPDVIVPLGFESWLARLLAKNPLKRFVRAVDAAMALLMLPPLPDNPYPQPGDEPVSEADETIVAATQTLMFSDTLALTETREPGRVPESRETGAMPGVQRIKVQAPPMPSSWESGQPTEDPVWKSTAITLFHVRPVPLIGRRELQNALWAALARVRETSSSRCIILDGPPGVGKTRLAEWLAVYADEVGVANVLRAYHRSQDPDMYGLAGMFLRYFRIGGLDTELAIDRVADWARETGFPEYIPVARELVKLAVSPAKGEDLERFASEPAAKVLLELLKVVAQDRPALLVLDDLSGAEEGALQFARALLEEESVPALILITTRRTLGVEPQALEELLPGARTTTIEIPELSTQHRIALFEDYLGMEADDARALADYADGNPQISVELVRNLIDQRVLLQTPDGYAIDRGAPLTLPPEMRDAVNARLDAFLALWPVSERADLETWLEVGAVLGAEVDLHEWERASRLLGVDPRDFLDRAATHGLVVHREHRWAFQAQMVRDRIMDRAEEAGRSQHLHSVCLEALPPDGDPLQKQRRALHLYASGAAEKALEPLLSAAEEMLLLQHYNIANATLETFIEAAEAVDIEVDSILVGRALAAMARVHSLGRHVEASTAMAKEALRIAHLHDDPTLLLVTSMLDLLRNLYYGTRDETLASVQAVLACLPRVTDLATSAAARGEVASAASFFGEPELSLRMARMAIADSESLGAAQRQVLLAQGCGAALSVGALDQAQLWFAQFNEERPSQPGPLLGFSNAYETQLLVALGEFDAALRLLDRQAATIGVRHRWPAVLQELFRQVCYARTEPWRLNDAMLEKILSPLDATLFEHSLARQLQCVQALRKKDLELASQRLRESRVATDTGKSSYLLALQFGWTAETADELGFHDFAAQVRELSNEQWRRLGRHRSDASISSSDLLHSID